MLCSQNGGLVQGIGGGRTKEDLVHSLQGRAGRGGSFVSPYSEHRLHLRQNSWTPAHYSIHFAIFHQSDVVECIKKLLLGERRILYTAYITCDGLNWVPETVLKMQIQMWAAHHC